MRIWIHNTAELRRQAAGCVDKKPGGGEGRVPAALPGGARLASQPPRHHCRLQAQGPRGHWIQVTLESALVISVADPGSGAFLTPGIRDG